MLARDSNIWRVGTSMGVERGREGVYLWEDAGADGVTR